MPWCPICKNEYREGIKTCADCGAALVETLSDADDKERLCVLGDEPTAEKFLSYLTYSGIEAESRFDPDENNYKVFVKKEDLKKAKAEFGAFVTVESNPERHTCKADDAALSVEAAEDENGEITKAIHIDSLEDLEKLKSAGISGKDFEEMFKNVTETQKYKPAGVYQSQSDKASDYYSTGYTFLIIGIAVIIFTFLNLVGVISLFKGQILSIVVFFALGAAACVVGIGSFKRSKKAGEQVAAEEKLTADINAYMEKHKDIMTSGRLSGEDGTSEEILYLDRTAKMKQELEKVFGRLDDDYVDSLLDDFYNKNFD